MGTSHNIAKAYDVKQNVLRTSADLDPLITAIGDARFVLLGEASHGTHEYYTWRSAISKRLIQEKGFQAIAVEGDWPDCYRINRFVKGFDTDATDIVKVLKSFNRWPTWMWGNWEIAALAEWLKGVNHYKKLAQGKVGFYGLDVYSLWESLDLIKDYLQKHDPVAAKFAENVVRCFEPFNEEGHRYARSLSPLSEGCMGEVLNLLKAVKQRSSSYDHDPEAALNTELNAQVVANAEAYYRSMISMEERSWNVRDTHMVMALESIADFHGKNSKIIVWEHNTHVGDARYTNMKEEGLLNVGQLLRQKYNSDVFITGFASYEGSVIAGRQWGSRMEKMFVPPAEAGSLEDLLHHESEEDRLIRSNCRVATLRLVTPPCNWRRLSSRIRAR